MENNKLINQSHETYSQIRNTLIIAQTKVTAVVNTAMVGLIGKSENRYILFVLVVSKAVSDRC